MTILCLKQKKLIHRFIDESDVKCGSNIINYKVAFSTTYDQIWPITISSNGSKGMDVSSAQIEPMHSISSRWKGENPAYASCELAHWPGFYSIRDSVLPV